MGIMELFSLMVPQVLVKLTRNIETHIIKLNITI